MRAEANWLAGVPGPSGAMKHLDNWGFRSERLDRLFLAACARSVQITGWEESNKTAVDVAEDFADGLVPEAALTHALRNMEYTVVRDWYAAWHCVMPHLKRSVEYVTSRGGKEATEISENDPRGFYIRFPRGKVQTEIIFDLWGNIFRAVRLTSCVTPEVRSVANACYHERTPSYTLDPVRLLVLADALEEYGCRDEEALRHLRGFRRCATCLGCGRVDKTVWDEERRPLNKTKITRVKCGSAGVDGCNGEGWVANPAPHYRGCWVVDYCLGKRPIRGAVSRTAGGLFQ
jgi:hypothetical protein